MTDDLADASETERAEQPLTNPDEALYRQVHPSWIADGVPSSQAFKPTKKDEGMLSIALGSKTTPEGAFAHHTQVLQRESVGTWGVSVAQATDAGLRSYEQPLDDSPAHGFIDFRGLARGQTEAKAKLLLGKARHRGRLYPPP
ncbi:MAG: hypothetical protein ACRDLF_04175 [Solirubrobacteraceae bacterium]